MGEISLAALPPSKPGQVGEVVGQLLWELAGSEVEAGMGRVAGHCFPRALRLGSKMQASAGVI